MSTNDGISSDDLAKKANEDWKKSQEPSPGDQSKAAYSAITTPDQDERKRGIAEGIISDLGNQRIDIDSLKEVIKVISEQQNQLAILVNQQTQAINNIGQGKIQNTENPQQGLNMENLTALSDAAEKIISAWKSYKGTDMTQDNFTQQIVDRSKKEAFESLDIVSLINQKVKKNLVNDIASDVAGNVVKTSSDSSHAPQ